VYLLCAADRATSIATIKLMDFIVYL